MRVIQKVLTIGMGLMFVAQAMADVPFNGLILDSSLQPVKKVKVYVNDPKRYAKTDKQGRFGLTDVALDDTITVELNKKEKIRIAVDGRESLKIVLAADGSNPKAEYDEEIANTGYGYVKRREYTGSSAGISGEKLRATGAHDILGALKGLVAGLNINGSPGSYEVNIRGVKSIMLSSEPIYILDGVQVNSIDFISLNDVDHVEVLKDAPQYGSRGANGAILVSTNTAAK